jgi:putative DNA primase/helicase
VITTCTIPEELEELMVAPAGSTRSSEFDPSWIPEALRNLAQWVCWRYITRDGRQTKCPVRARDGSSADTTDPRSWASFEEAVAAWRAEGHAGIGFVFAACDPFCGIDLDGCIDESGVIVPAAQEIIESFGSYCEVSPSGRGVKLFIIGRKPDWAACRSKSIPGFKETEIYDNERFFTITGQRVEAAPVEVRDCQPSLEKLCRRLWPQRLEPRPAAVLPTAGFEGEDEALLLRVRGSADGMEFFALWNGDLTRYGGDWSAADLALCNRLAFWTGRDAARMDRLFRQSALYRPKWDAMRGDRTYGEMTIEKAIAGCKNVYGPTRPNSGASPNRQVLGGDVVGEDDSVVRLGYPDPATGRLVLSPRRTLPTAEAYVRAFNDHPEGRTLHGYGGTLMEWRGNRYCQIEDDEIRHRLHPWLHGAVRYTTNPKTGQLELVDFESNPATVKHALETVRALVHLSGTIIAPAWLTGDTDRPPPLELLPCKTVNLHIPTGQVYPSTPVLFNINALDFDYEPNPKPPAVWLEFLRQVFGDDQESIELLQEWIGYCLTADTRHQKMLLLVGPRRSGKGTIGRVVTQLVGAGNVVGPTTGSLAGTFGLQPLIGKSLAIVSDARFGGESASVVVERLLCISGEDTLTIDRKFLGAVSMKLPTRFMLLTNELPRLNDASTALAGRFLVLRLTKSFFGREDVGLSDRLMLELPGILVWAIEGWKRLHARGCFLQPTSGEDAIQDMEDLASPVGAFVRERCTVGAGHRVSVSDIYLAWKTWCEQDGRSAASTKQAFGRDLMAAVSGVTRRRGSGLVGFYEGISMRSEEAK